MKFKKSMYNILLLDNIEENCVPIFNTLSCAFGIMDEKTYNLYKDIENIADFASLSEDLKELISALSSNEFIVDNSLDEYSKVKTLSNIARFNSKTLGLTIAPTLNCNMICPYCYQYKTNTTMNTTIKNHLINFVKNYIDNAGIKHLDVTWYGGEPLLEYNLISDLSSEFISLCKENKISYKASMVSNGSLLNRETASILKNDYSVDSVQITIDGLKHIHNQRRKLKNQQDSFDLIIDNIEKCKDIMEIKVRINVDKDNLNDTKNLIDYLFDTKKLKHKIMISFAPVVNNSNICTINSNKCFTNEEFAKIEKELLNYMYNKNYINVSDMDIKPLYSSCAAIGLNYYVVDPDGDLYTCWENIGKKQFNIGNLESGYSLNQNYLSWLSLDYPQKCKSCNWLPMCQSGCPYKLIDNEDSLSCSYKIEVFKELLKLMAKDSLRSDN